MRLLVLRLALTLRQLWRETKRAMFKTHAKRAKLTRSKTISLFRPDRDRASLLRG